MGRISYDFVGERVLVTGASRGIGRAIAEGYAKAGAEVYLLADDAAVVVAAEQVAAATGAGCHPIECDITDADAVVAALDQIGHIDVLVNNAGLERITPIADPEAEATFRRIIEINVIGTYLVTRRAVGHMTEGGRIILTASIWSRTAVPEFSAYVASKHANLGFMRSIAHELGPRGIRVNAVCPGWVRTEAAMLSLANMAKATGRAGAGAPRCDRGGAGASRVARAARHGAALPLSRLGRRAGHHRTGLHARPWRGNGMTGLEDRLVLVTGAHRGIGAACARAFAAAAPASPAPDIRKPEADARVFAAAREKKGSYRTGLRRRRRAARWRRCSRS